LEVYFVMTSTCEESNRLHVAIIMDGNGRWASVRGWPRTAGHRAGAESVRRVVESAGELDIGTLTLYAFSSDNWKRPEKEVSTLLGLFERYLDEQTEKCVKHGIRLSVIGRRDRFSLALCAAIERAENRTVQGKNLHVRLAVDYSARGTILDVVRRLRSCEQITPESFERMLVGPDGAAARVDLLIRTGGEQRLSDFLLWECAYAELWFTPVMWPEFAAVDLKEAVEAFHQRDRRFGGVSLESKAG
jgi:undecaprenyl diphosphate synthase